MWRKFDADVIRKDLKILKEHGLIHLRVFPNWRDFQPAVRLYVYKGTPRDISQSDDSFFKNANCINFVMLDRFSKFCYICDEYGVKLMPITQNKLK